MNNKKNLIFWVVVALLGASLIFYSYFSRLIKYVGSSISPGVEQSPTSESTPRPDSTPSTGSGQVSSPSQATSSSTEEPFLGLHDIKSPATCQVGGEIDFLSKDMFLSKDSKISWQNVDSQGRLINWHITPKDSLKIGPNLFANLTIPNGEYQNLTVHLPENPVSKSYLLTVSVTYGQFIQGDLKVKEVNCSGSVKVNLNF